MKTTLEIPDSLFRQAKAKAALEGRKLKDLVAEGLRLVMANTGTQERRNRAKFPLIKSKRQKPLEIPDDIAARVDLAEDLKRYEASLR